MSYEFLRPFSASGGNNTLRFNKPQIMADEVESK